MKNTEKIKFLDSKKRDVHSDAENCSASCAKKFFEKTLFLAFQGHFYENRRFLTSQLAEVVTPDL